MTGRSAQSRKWLARALRTGRAAAFLVLATGINGTIAALEPRYEPIYVYLASVVIVAWLGSTLLGVMTAVAAVICYDWMFSPVRMVPSIASVVPLAIAIAAALATQLAKIPLKPRAEIPPTPPPPLLSMAERSFTASPVEMAPPPIEATPPQVHVSSPHAVDRTEVVELQRKLNESMAASRLRQAAHQQELDAARNETAQQTKKAEAIRAQLDAALRRVTEHEERVAALQQELDLAWRKVDEEKSRGDREAGMTTAVRSQVETELAEARRLAAEAENARRIVQQQLDSAKRVAQEENARADREATLRAQLENAARATLHKTADVSSSHQRAAAEAQQRAAEAERKLAEAEQRRIEAERKLAAAEQKRLEAERKLATAEETRAEAEQRAAEFDGVADTAAQTAASLETQLALAAAASEGFRLRSESLEASAATLQEELDRVRALLEEESARADRETELREVQEITSARKHDASLVEARERIVTLQEDIEALNKLIAEERAANALIQEADSRNLERIVAGITTDYENSLGQALVDKEAARAELRSLIPRLEREKKRADDEKAARERAEAEANERIAALTAERQTAEKEWDEKLTRIVSGITSDYENSLGESLVEKEAARAELRTLTTRVAELRKALDGEKAAKASLESEWSEKLQKIVAHLASDHEADIGEAMMAKEAAKAEVRTLTARVASLQQKIRELTPLSDHAPVVLVVHSDPAVRAMSKQALEQSGYSVVTASDGLEGLRYAAANRPDVVLAEAVMPKMNGRELVQLLKSRPETSSMKIVLMSENHSAEGSSDFHADDFIADPADFKAMRDTLANVLARA